MEKSMNIMRKLWDSGPGGGGQGQGQGGGPGQNQGGPPGGGYESDQSISLGLMHLRKLFSDYLHSPSEDKIYNMLPLFNKVFATSSASGMIEKFPEINSFCLCVSKLMVIEIRKRATNQSTEDAAVNIIKFLEMGGDGDAEDSKGWSLLSTLNLLSSGDQDLVETMTSASVPSTLVKCLYIFFDLPELKISDTKSRLSSEFSPMEKRLLLQKIFVQLLIRLCSYTAPSEELAKQDDLALLFLAVTSTCPQYNTIWRKSASEVLMTISTHGLSPTVLSYIHNKGCIQMCIDNLKNDKNLAPLEFTEMILTIFCFLKDSSEISQYLLDDFKSQGYLLLTEIILRLENEPTPSSSMSKSSQEEALTNLVLVVSSLCMCGHIALKPNMANVNSLFNLPSFQLPPTTGTKGTTVRNLPSFQVLQVLFTKSKTSFLALLVIDSILTIFKSDPSNYFIADSILPQMAEKLLLKKSSEVNQKFLEIVEFIVFQLQFAPTKELIAISRLLKNDISEMLLDGGTPIKNASTEIENETKLKLMCVKMLQNLVKHNILFKDVFREVGILEVLITCLHRFSIDILNPQNDENKILKNELGSEVIEILTILLSGNNSNVNIFRENNGSKSTIQIVTTSSSMRPSALCLIHQVQMSLGGDEDMSALLVLLHSSEFEADFAFKIDVLQGLISCFRESHRARCNFRKSGGFLYLMSLLLSMEGHLQKPRITDQQTRQILRERMHLIQLIFTSFSLAMRFEPANAKFFSQEICLPSLADTLRLLGCFSKDNDNDILKCPSELQSTKALQRIMISDDALQQFYSIFTSFSTTINYPEFQDKIPYSLVLTVFIFRLLFDLATDAFERNVLNSPFPRSPRKILPSSATELSTMSTTSPMSTPPTSPNPCIRKIANLNLTPPLPEPVVIHPSAVIVMIRLIPSISTFIEDQQHENNTKPVDETITNTCQLFCAELVKSLVRNERNQQIMVQVGLTEEILERCSTALSDENNFLHSPLHYAFERVATQSVSPRDLRRYIRLGNPLNCERITQLSNNCSPVPLSRLRSIVSMTTLKSTSNQNQQQTSVSSFGQFPPSAFPSFVEFDMSAEGFGCIFMPSVATHSYPMAGDNFGSTTLLASGIGIERIFPGSSGMSFSTWISVEKFSDPRVDPHPIRLLTILKEINNCQRLCLSIIISARDKAVIISTRESEMPPLGVGEWENTVNPPGTIRVWCPELLNETQWNHLFFVFSSSSNNSFSLFVNGRPVHGGKLDYPHRSKGATYSAFIGTPPIWRKTSRLTWRQGVSHLFEDWTPQGQTITAIYKLGPEYPGSFQAAVKTQSQGLILDNNVGALVSEDKIIFGLNALAISSLTLAKIRKIYSKSDAKAIAKQIGLSSHENSTPITILHNSAAHLIGPGRCFGGVSIGYLGVRIFNPHPVSKSILSLGGIPILIGLVAISNSGESLYASLKALVCVVKCHNTQNGSNWLLDRTSCQTLGYLLKRKKNLLSMRILHLIISLVTNDVSPSSSGNGNVSPRINAGFIDLLGDLEIWTLSNNQICGKEIHYSSGSSSPILKVSIPESGEGGTPASKQQDTFTYNIQSSDLEKALYEHFLQMLTEDPKASVEVLRESNLTIKLLRRLSQNGVSLNGPLNQSSIFLLLGHLLAHKGNNLSSDIITFGHFIVGLLPNSPNDRETYLTESIELRNKGLQLLHSLMYTGKVINVGFCEEVVSRLGFDFILLFIGPNIHASTLLWALRILLLLITSSSGLKNRFRDAPSGSFCFGKTVQFGGRHFSVSMLPLKRQDTKDEDSDSSPVGPSAVANMVTQGLTGKGIKSGKTSGWARLSWLLAQRCEDIKTEGNEILPNEVWLIICAMVLNQPCKNIGFKSGNDTEPLTLDAIWLYVFALSSNKMSSSLYGKVSLCPDAIIALLTLVRCFITAETINYNISSPSMMPNSKLSPSSSSSQSDTGSCLIQFLSYLYSNTPEFQSIFMSTEILSALASSTMPIEIKSESVNPPNDILDYTCEEIKAFPDSESILLIKNLQDLASADTGEEAFENNISTPRTPKTPNYLSEDNLSNTPQSARSTGGGGTFQFPEPPNSTQNTCTENLMNHPSKKMILDFLRMIIIDWMSISSHSKSAEKISNVIDTVLEAGLNIEATGENNVVGNYSTVLLAQFHTNFLSSILDHLIAFDLERMIAYLPAVAHFLSRVVDKLWLQTFVRPNIETILFDFIVLLVNFSKTKRIPSTTIDLIYNSLNRVILYILSRKSKDLDKIEALKKLRTLRTVIFGSGNHQQEFFGCLTYVLMQLFDRLPIPLESGNRTRWHVRVLSTTDENLEMSKKDIAKMDKEISSTSDKVWDDLFISKKPIIEEVYKITFPSPQPPPISSLRDQIGETGNKLWLQYIASETNPLSKKIKDPALSQTWELHTQLQSKLQKVTGGLTRLAGNVTRSGSRKDSEKEKTIRDLVSQWTNAKKIQNLSNKYVYCVKENLEAQDKFNQENQRHLHRFVRDTLLPQLEADLTRERGVFGPYEPSHLDKWTLDTTEGPCRMRKKLIRNEMFYIHYPYQQEQLQQLTSSGGSVTSSPKAKRINPPISRDSKEFHKKFKHQPSLISEMIGTSISSIDEVVTASVSSNEENTANNPAGSTSSDLSPKIPVQSSLDDPFSEGSCEDPDNQSMLFRLIGSNTEKISQIFRVAQIQGLDTIEGILLFGKDMFYLVNGFTILTKTREVKDMYYLPPNCYEPILPLQCYSGSSAAPAKPRSKTHACLKFNYDVVREVHKRRYLLQPIALEIFCSDGRNYLLAFPRKVRNVVYQKLITVAKGLTDTGIDGKMSVAGQKRSASVEQSSGIFSSLLIGDSVTQRWVRGDISNFQYLMHLNTLAGRSYNDLMQYPVFPWILSDYDSFYLDLNDPATFRDLSKPMGAQSSSRLVQFVKRYKEWDYQPQVDETPPYHYGTHYSSAMIVCSYLVRMEPFAQHFLRLQGGHFDLADRMFNSIKEGWTSASKHNMADVKELIPEFFYLPEFLKNSNNFDLGTKQNGIALNDVILPPWAKGDPREFIRVHRMALECDYVSQHLHEWIDLIFGYKQQGPAAVEAVNVFHHLFYEGNVDIYTIDDPLKKNATIGFINNFGQIPKQLFKKAHPIKRVNAVGKLYNLGVGMILDSPNPLMALAVTAGATNQVNTTEKVFYHHIESLRPSMSPISLLKGPIGQIMPLERGNSIIAVEQNKVLLSQNRYISWGFADTSVRICFVETDRPCFLFEQPQQLQWMSMGEIVACATASEKVVVTGNTNSVVSVWEVCEKELRLKSHLFGHTEAITCLSCSLSYNIIVSGSKDCTAIIWDLARLTFVRQLVPHTSQIDAVGVNELNGDIATCDGSWLRIWTINGDLIGQIDTAGIGGGGGMSQGILCVTFSYLNEWEIEGVVITGSTDGIVRMWSICYVQVPKDKAEYLKLLGESHGTSYSDDSSIASQDSQIDQQLIENRQQQQQNETDLLSADVFDPDKDRDSLEDRDILPGDPSSTTTDENKDDQRQQQQEKEKEALDNILESQDQLQKSPLSMNKGVVRRQRALSSGTSAPKSSTSDEQSIAEAKKMKRRSEIPKEVSSSGGDCGRAPSIRCSKSENSLSFDADESFEMVSDSDVAFLRNEERKQSVGTALLNAHLLKEGNVWDRKISFRGKLSMHTAYDRKDNAEPASITALAISKDHKYVYVGDARGRVFSWTVSDTGKTADHWVKDESGEICSSCEIKFSMTERKHHCRNCGQIFCQKCTRFESEIFRLKILRPVRVCSNCFIQLKGGRPPLNSSSENVSTPQ